ncbi:MAG TPA: TIGR04255 family protein [Verrucomicrobiae bacterium]|jgi:uncharacterized protein (TIGR04255 family)|nr:TIGR04255 family protein [Verrucomicrobiae bacterium]
MSEFKIDATQTFEHLPHAPIVEAIIALRARATVPWDETTIANVLKPQLADYPQMAVQNSLVVGFTIMPGPLATTNQQDLWKGLQFKSGDGRNVATFDRDGFTFSRLQPYQDWSRLQVEAMRLWRIHAKVARPPEIERLGVRFINRIELPTGAVQLEDYIEPHPKTPVNLDLPFSGFLHMDTFRVPGQPYTMNVVRALQPPQPLGTSSPALIVDIDVSVLQAADSSDIKWVEDRLAEMRWLKNKAFFGTITEKVKQSFK